MKNNFKNLQVSDNDLIGNKFNGHDLHFYLQEKGIKSSQLVWNKESNDKNTFVIAGEKKDRIEIRKTIIENQNTYNLNGINNFLFYDILYSNLFLNADIIHFHLMHNWLIDLNLLPIVSKLKPIIWTVHDPWLLGGHCVHHYDCSKWQKLCSDCPYLESHFKLNKDNSTLNFLIKKNSIQNSNLDIIVASKWMYDKLHKSDLFKSKRIHLVPFGINLSIFKQKNKIEVRKKFNIEPDDLVLTFRCDYSEFKGMDYVEYVLSRIKTNKKIVILTTAGYPKVKLKFKTINFGWVKDDQLLSDIYNATDIFLAPSKMDAFGMMVIEAMACGAVPVVLEGTALPETINSPVCGIATKRDKVIYLKEIQLLINNKEKLVNRSKKCLDFAKKTYNKDQYVEKIIKIYQQAIKNHKTDSEYVTLLNQLKKNIGIPPMRVLEKKIVNLNTDNVKNTIFKKAILTFYKVDKIIPKQIRARIKRIILKTPAGK